MTVAELIEKLRAMPQDALVIVHGPYGDHETAAPPTERTFEFKLAKAPTLEAVFIGSVEPLPLG